MQYGKDAAEIKLRNRERGVVHCFRNYDSVARSVWFNIFLIV